MVSTVPDDTSVPMNRSNCSQSDRRYGRPAVGRLSNTFERDDASPVSRPSQNGEDADNARKCGM